MASSPTLGHDPAWTDRRPLAGNKLLIEPSDPRLHQLLHQDHGGLLELLKGPRTHKVGIAFEVLILWGIEQALG